MSLNESVTNSSKLRLAQNDLRSILSSPELKVTLPEFLGALKIENNLIYEQPNGVIIGWTPILGEGKTNALILSIGTKDNWAHKLILRDKLHHYYQGQPNSQGLPLSSVKQIFQFYDSPPKPRKKSETQSQGSSETKENTDLKFQRNQNIKNGWVEECAWHLAYRYTPEVGDVDYYEFYYICEQVYVESTPGDPITIDENSGGGSSNGDFRNCAGALSCFPLVKYPPGSDYTTTFPKLTEYLKNQLPKLRNNSKIISAIQKYTNLTEAEIKKQLQWGEGPVIKVVQLDYFCSTCTVETEGAFKGTSDPNSIYLDIDLVNDMENSVIGSDMGDAFAFLLGATLLHELVHLGDWKDGSDYPGEEGQLFEKDIYGKSVWRNNAQLILKGN